MEAIPLLLLAVALIAMVVFIIKVSFEKLKNHQEKSEITKMTPKDLVCFDRGVVTCCGVFFVLSHNITTS